MLNYAGEYCDARQAAVTAVMLFNASNACNARNTHKLHQRNRHSATDNFNVEKSACKSVKN